MAKKTLSEKLLLKTMDWAYEKAVNGFSKVDSAEELAIDCLENSVSRKAAVSKIIRTQKVKAAASGFITGVPGLMALPVTIPSNVASILFIQIRMICAIAYISGYDLKDERVKTLVYLCLAGSSASEILKDVDISIGKQVAYRTMRSLSAKSSSIFNQKVGFRLFRKFGAKSAPKLSKALPLIGGILGGSYDYFSTNTIANIAQRTFFEEN